MAVNSKQINMRKILFYSFLILILGSGVTAKAAMKDGSIDIPIKTGNGNNYSDVPRMPAFVPITCEYEDGVLYFGFNYDLGSLTVTVTNEDTNQQWQAVLQTSSGYNTMNISEDTGCYHIEIITIYNVVYQGDFEI